MKCPKCGYLGFERVDRCRNCGYDFSLTQSSDPLELPLNVDQGAPIEDWSFLDTAMASQSVHVVGPVRSLKADRHRAASSEAGSAQSSGELPLFGSAIPGDLPLITKTSPPRPPLAVRRATPEVARLRSTSARAATLDLGPEVPTVPAAPAPAYTSIERPSPVHIDAVESAPIGARFLAVASDLLILAIIDVVVVYFTMQICGVGFAELGILPRAPLVAFLLVQNLGYLVALTAGGQTLGKMAAGIRVVSAEPHEPLDFNRAFVRELMWLVLAAPAGLGLLTALTHDRRGIHDRLAGTRVVRS